MSLWPVNESKPRKPVKNAGVWFSKTTLSGNYHKSEKGWMKAMLDLLGWPKENLIVQQMLNLTHCHNEFNTAASSLAHMTKLKDKGLKLLLISLRSSNYWGSNTAEQILVVFKNKCDFFVNHSSTTSNIFSCWREL